jgi:hypothetical protein
MYYVVCHTTNIRSNIIFMIKLLCSHKLDSQTYTIILKKPTILTLFSFKKSLKIIFYN